MREPRISSGNVFDDLGYDSEEAALLSFKSRLLSVLAAFVNTFDNQSEAAAALRIARPRISEIKNGHLDRFTIDLLLTWCHRAGLRISSFELQPMNVPQTPPA